jgi:hypothetical protein
MAITSSGSAVTGVQNEDRTAQAIADLTKDATTNAGNLVSDLASGYVSDVDTGGLSGIAIISAPSGNGTWQYRLSGNNTWTNVGPVSTTSGLLLRSSDYLRLLPDTYNGTTAAVTFRAWDQTSPTGGFAGTKSTTATNGGTAAFSTDYASAHITVADVNDAPFATNLPSLSTPQSGSC